MCDTNIVLKKMQLYSIHIIQEKIFLTEVIFSVSGDFNLHYVCYSLFVFSFFERFNIVNIILVVLSNPWKINNFSTVL